MMHSSRQAPVSFGLLSRLSSSVAAMAPPRRERAAMMRPWSHRCGWPGRGSPACAANAARHPPVRGCRRTTARMSFHRHQDAAVAASLDVVSVPRIRGAFVQVSGLPTTMQAKHPGRGAFVKQDGASDLPRDHLASFRMHCGAIRSKGSAPRREPRSGNRHTRAVVAAMAGRTAVQFAAFHWPGPPSCRRTVPRSAPGPQRAAAGCDGRVRAEGAGSTLAGYQVGLPGRGAWTPRNPCGRGG